MSNSNNAKRIALSGVLGALAVICLFMAAYLPTGRLGLYALASFFSAVIVMEFGAGAGWLFFAATSLLSFFIIPDKLGILPYVLFFGIYGIAKFYIEKIGKLVPELMLKIVFFNLCLGVAFILAKQVFPYAVDIRLPWYIALIAAEIAFVVYDYVYSLFIAYYRERMRKYLRI